MLTKEQTLELKKQLSKQIQHLPADKKAQAQAQIDSMSSEALEEMLEEQKNIQNNPKKEAKQKGIYRLIIDKEIPSKIIEENPDALAVLEIKPLSKAHILIIPKIPVIGKNKMPAKAFSLARKLAKRVEKKLHASSVEIQTETKFGEQIINILPRYNDSKLERYDASDSELSEVQNKLFTKKIIRTKKTKVAKVEKNLPVMKRRLP